MRHGLDIGDATLLFEDLESRLDGLLACQITECIEQNLDTIFDLQMTHTLSVIEISSSCRGELTTFWAAFISAFVPPWASQ